MDHEMKLEEEESDIVLEKRNFKIQMKSDEIKMLYPRKFYLLLKAEEELFPTIRWSWLESILLLATNRWEINHQ